MKKSRYSDSQILAILKQAEGGISVAQLCREHGKSRQLSTQWRSKFGGMDAVADGPHERIGKRELTSQMYVYPRKDESRNSRLKMI